MRGRERKWMGWSRVARAREKEISLVAWINLTDGHLWIHEWRASRRLARLNLCSRASSDPQILFADWPATRWKSVRGRKSTSSRLTRDDPSAGFCSYRVFARACIHLSFFLLSLVVFLLRYMALIHSVTRALMRGIGSSTFYQCISSPEIILASPPK